MAAESPFGANIQNLIGPIKQYGDNHRQIIEKAKLPPNTLPANPINDLLKNPEDTELKHEVTNFIGNYVWNMMTINGINNPLSELYLPAVSTDEVISEGIFANDFTKTQELEDNYNVRMAIRGKPPENRLIFKLHDKEEAHQMGFPLYERTLSMAEIFTENKKKYTLENSVVEANIMNYFALLYRDDNWKLLFLERQREVHGHVFFAGLNKWLRHDLPQDISATESWDFTPPRTIEIPEQPQASDLANILFLLTKASQPKNSQDDSVAL